MNDLDIVSLDERVCSCEYTITQLQKTVAELERRYLDMQNDLSLLRSIQRSYLDLELRVNNLERPRPVPNSMPFTPSTVPFGSVAKLVESIERLFVCKEGDHRHFHTAYGSDGGVSYHGYQVLGALTGGPDAQERLRQELYTAFLKIKEAHPSEHPVLYWRYAAQERIQEEHAEGTDVYRIRVRIAIPGADYSVVGPILATDGQPFVTLKRPHG